MQLSDSPAAAASALDDATDAPGVDFAATTAATDNDNDNDNDDDTVGCGRVVLAAAR